MDHNPSAAQSLGEGMEETLTVHRLHLAMQLRKTMASTNVIESAFSILEQVAPGRREAIPEGSGITTDRSRDFQRSSGRSRCHRLRGTQNAHAARFRLRR
jgi:hypothetical protein